MDGALVWGESHLARNAPCDGPVSDIAQVVGPRVTAHAASNVP
jgi:hypothetical protein